MISEPNVLNVLNVVSVPIRSVGRFDGTLVSSEPKRRVMSDLAYGLVPPAPGCTTREVGRWGGRQVDR